MRTWFLWCLLSLPSGLSAQEVRADPQAEAGHALRLASTHMARGDAAAALSALSKGAVLSAPGTYLRARALLALGRYRKALSALSSLASAGATLPVSVRAEVASLQHELRARLGECDPNRVEPAGDPQVQLRHGQCLLSAGNALQAVDALNGALRSAAKGRTVDRPVVELWLARAELAAHRTEDARVRLRSLHIRYPTHRIAADVDALRAGFPKRTELSFAEASERARAAFAARDFAVAARTYAALPVPKARSAAAAHLHAQGLALFRSRSDYAKAAQVLSKAAQLGGPKALFDAFHAARALSRADRDREAVAAFDRLVTKHRTGPWVVKSAYLSAWLRLRHGFPQARKRMQRFVDGPLGRKSPGQVAEGRFELAMDDLRHRRFPAAERGFARYAETGAGAMVRARGLYWAGRAAALQNRVARARSLYMEARAVEPLHYYAQLAELRLRQAGQVPEPLLLAPEIGHVRPASLSETSSFYAQLGLHADAARILRDDEPRKLQHPASLSQVLPYAQSHAELDNHVRAARLVEPFVSGLLRRPAVGDDGLGWRISFARPRLSVAKVQAEQSGVDADLLYAIMRKESAFDAAAHSYADAIGLMQLLPSTAEAVARQGEQGQAPPFDIGVLWNPDDNIRLGVRYLGGLLARYPQHPALAIAAYNAGTAHVDDWLARITHPGDEAEFDRFVETIPIQQTRNYVRRVLANWARYRYLSGRGQAPCFELTL